MKVLIVARYKEQGYAPFVREQVDALQLLGVTCQYFPMQGKGVRGYLKQLSAFRQAIKSFNPDIIHAHYGLCGLFANLQRRIPVVTTYHGSDINNSSVLRFSWIAIWLSAFNVFVSRRCVDIAKPKKNYAVIPCGIDLDEYPLLDKTEARKQMGLKEDRKYVLFAGAFDNPVKNAPLAKGAVSFLPDVELLELKGFPRQKVAVLLQAVDALLMTSFTEGSPQIIKEALACGCPIVSVDVGDVKERTKDVDGCWIVNNDQLSIKDALTLVFETKRKTNGRDIIMRDGLTNDMVASNLNCIYSNIVAHY